MKGVDSANEELEAAAGQHKGATVPADIIERVDVVSHFWDGGGDDCAILSGEGLVGGWGGGGRGVAYEGDEEDG